MQDCPSAERLAELIVLAREGDETLDEHLAGCGGCRELVASATAGDAEGAAHAHRQSDITVGTQVMHYQLEARAGAGASGEVFRARDTRLGRIVALKRLDPARHLDGRGRARLLHEARAAARLVHPAVATFYEIVQSGDDLCLAMEWVEGRTLRELYRELSPTQLLALLADVADGLAAAHAVGLTHGDVKPDNVLISKAGAAKVVDFGLARLLGEEDASAKVIAMDEDDDGGEVDMTATRLWQAKGTAAGTPAYMAPEVLQGTPANARTDQYAFFVMTVELLTGKRPFDGRNLAELSQAHAAPLRLGGVPRRLRALVEKGLAPRPEQRHVGMEVVAARLRAASTAPRRRLRLAIATGVLLLGTLAALVAWPKQRRQLVAPAPVRALILAPYDPVLGPRIGSRAPQDLMEIAVRNRDVVPALSAEAYLKAGRILGTDGKDAEAFDALDRAVHDAERAGDDHLRVTVLIAALYARIGRNRDVVSAHTLSTLADAAMVRVGDDPYLLARLRRAQSMLALQEKDLPLARRLIQEALQALEHCDAETDDPTYYYLALARVENYAGDPRARRDAARKAVVAAEQHNGNPTPVEVMPLSEQARSELAVGDTLAGERTAKRLLELATLFSGPDGLQAVEAEVHLAMVASRRDLAEGCRLALAAAAHARRTRVDKWNIDLIEVQLCYRAPQGVTIASAAAQRVLANRNAGEDERLFAQVVLALYAARRGELDAEGLAAIPVDTSPSGLTPLLMDLLLERARTYLQLGAQARASAELDLVEANLARFEDPTRSELHSRIRALRESSPKRLP